MRALPCCLALVALLPLAGCGLPLVCPKDPHDWYDQDNATYTLLNATFGGEKGSFDFDPIGKANTRRKGSYDLGSGDLAWVDSYDGDHWLRERKVEGYGTIYDNGNLDLLVKVTWTDVLDEIWAQLLRIERTRCEASVTRYEFDPDLSVDHAPESGADVGYWAEEIRSDTKVTQFGEAHAGGVVTLHDRTCTETQLSKDSWDYDGGLVTGQDTMKYDGTGSGTWAQYAADSGADYDFVGEKEYYFDGSYLDAYGLYTPGTSTMRGFWSILYQYDGSGSGTYTGYNAAGNPNLDCDVTITAAGRCTASCDDGNDYDCS